jgi:hypothetical protein
VNTWLDILRTNNLNLLVKSGIENDETKLSQAWDSINDEFNRLRSEKSTVTQYDKIQYRELIKLIILFGTSLINRLIERIDDKLIFKETFEMLIGELSSWGFRMNKEKPIYEEIEKVVAEIQALQTSFEILTEELFPDKSEFEEDVEADQKQQLINVHKTLLLYENMLKRTIDWDKKTLFDLVVIEQQVKEIIELSKKE